MENKLYKVTIEISFSDCEGKREIKRERKTQFFETLNDAIYFYRHELTGWSQIVNRQIWEYSISSVKELHEKEREIIKQVKSIERYWE